MKYLPFVFTALAGVSLATPLNKRQDIDFAAYDSIPVLPDVAAPAGDIAPATVVYDASSVASAAAAAATEQTDIGTGSDAAVTKRSSSAIFKRKACDSRTAGTGPAVRPDTTAAFQSYGQFTNDANSATVPVGYNRIVTNSNSAAQDSTYMTYKMMSSYDTAGCAAYCQAHQGCNSFNLFYERDPTVEPGSGCTNPPSLTYIKCSIFGGVLTAASAKNNGQWASSFHVVIAGSDIYVATAPATPGGFDGPYNYGNKSINAPSGYMGVQTFPQTQPYDPSVCAAACDEKSAYDVQHGLPSTDNPDVCNFFVAYVLYKNGDNGVFTCAYYNSIWDSSYATNQGQYDSKRNHYTIGYSNGFAKTAPTDITESDTCASMCDNTNGRVQDSSFESGFSSWDFATTSGSITTSNPRLAFDGCRSIKFTSTSTAKTTSGGFSLSQTNIYLGPRRQAISFYLGRPTSANTYSASQVSVSWAGTVVATFDVCGSVDNQCPYSGTGSSSWQYYIADFYVDDEDANGTLSLDFSGELGGESVLLDAVSQRNGGAGSCQQQR